MPRSQKTRSSKSCSRHRPHITHILSIFGFHIFSFSRFSDLFMTPTSFSGPAGTFVVVAWAIYLLFRHPIILPIVISLCILICTTVHPIPLLHRSFPATHRLTHFPFPVHCFLFNQFVDRRHRQCYIRCASGVVCKLRASRPNPRSAFGQLYCIRYFGQHIKPRPIITPPGLVPFVGNVSPVRRHSFCMW